MVCKAKMMWGIRLTHTTIISRKAAQAEHVKKFVTTARVHKGLGERFKDRHADLLDDD